MRLRLWARGSAGVFGTRSRAVSWISGSGKDDRTREAAACVPPCTAPIGRGQNPYCNRDNISARIADRGRCARPCEARACRATTWVGLPGHEARERQRSRR